MLGNRPAQESELVGPICARFGLTIEASRLLISEGRKVGFVVDCGALPQSTRCFVEEFPTPSTSMERNSSRGKALCLLPNGFKVVGLVEGSVYLGEVVYDENWKRSYKFHLVEGPDIVKSSSPCSNPTSAFKEIEAVIKVASTKKRHRKPDARSNGKLYMAVMYSATQKLLREKFRGCENQVPSEVRPLFMEWMENVSSNKAFNGHESTSIIPTHLPSSVAPPPPMMPKPHHMLPASMAGSNKIHPVPSHHAHTNGSSGPLSALPQIKKDERNFSISSRFGFPFDLESDIINGDLHLSLDDANMDHFFATTGASTTDTKPFETGIASANGNHAPLQEGLIGAALTGRKRGSGSLDDFLASSQAASDAASRKRSSGSIDEHSPVLITRKRASGSIDEDAMLLKEAGPTSTKRSDSLASMQSGSMLADANELFADYFRMPDLQLPGKRSISIPAMPPMMHSMSLGHPVLSPRDGGITLPTFEDLIDPADIFGAAATQLGRTLRSPRPRSLNPSQIRAAISSLMHMSRESLSQKAIEEIFDACDRERSGLVTLDDFVDALEGRERELLEQFRKIDKDGTGDITLEALRAARAQGTIRMEDLDMDDLMSKMDGLSFSATNPLAPNRKIRFPEFRSMVLPLPTAAQLRAALEASRTSSAQTESPEAADLLQV